MKCENCRYCKGGQLPESYEEEWWCIKGYGDPVEDMGCNHFFFYPVWNFITRPYWYLKWLFWHRLNMS